ncbi:hypothetical protein SAMN05421819_2074 [Bryocella elongata]|uniref:Uncharacterized protein n=1 Tax=Bryocella elongata TaxID=863522 RepID=A0A1H5Y204_9BACT|nr:hypothetical protein [Bryocella elongata]SEG17815.1 hypothetical protein SAMN05421819_2074 [Bryocella elongata]
MATANHVEQARRDGVVLGVPLGDLGWFQSLLMGTAAGMASFFASTFCAIMGFLVYLSVTHKPVDFARTYRDIGFPIGLVVLIVSYVYLGYLWIRRKARRTRSEN